MKKVIRWLGLLSLLVLLGLQSSCKDQTARDWTMEVADSLKVFSARNATWALRVHNGLCQVEKFVFSDDPANAPDETLLYCLQGPPPADPPDPIEDPWAEECDSPGDPPGCWDPND